MKIVSSPFSFRGKSYLGKIYRPYLQVFLSSDKIDEWIPVEILVDTGADYSLFPKRYADLLGIDLQKDCFYETTYGVGGKEGIYLCKKDIKIKIGSFEKEIPGGFLERDEVPPLLGRLGCLEVLTLIMKNRTTILEAEMNRFNAK